MSDGDGPEISFVGISPTTASGGDEVTVTFSISDATGMTGAGQRRYVYLKSDTVPYASDIVFFDDSGWVLVSGDATNGTYEATLTVESVAGGLYDILVKAEDDLLNLTTETFEDVLTIEANS